MEQLAILTQIRIEMGKSDEVANHDIEDILKKTDLLVICKSILDVFPTQNNPDLKFI